MSAKPAPKHRKPGNSSCAVIGLALVSAVAGSAQIYSTLIGSFS